MGGRYDRVMFSCHLSVSILSGIYVIREESFILLDCSGE